MRKVTKKERTVLAGVAIVATIAGAVYGRQRRVRRNRTAEQDPDAAGAAARTPEVPLDPRDRVDLAPGGYQGMPV